MTREHGFKSTNDVKEEAIIEYFRKNIGRRGFILTEAFPFMFIGKIKSIVEDMVVLDVETTSVPALEGREWMVHIHSIEVFYIETGIGAKIPRLKDS